MSFPWTLVCYETLGSTQEHCKVAAESGASHGFAVLALRQSAGRGTRGRVWTAPEGNLSFSFLCRHEQAILLVQVLPFIVAVALYEALVRCVPTAVLRLKWPNDIVHDGAKLSGILIEKGGDSVSPWIVIGIGVNLRQAPEIVGRKTVSLAALGGTITADSLARLILDHFAFWLAVWERDGFTPIRQAWLDRAHELGSRLAVERGGNYIEGFFAGLDECGRLLLQTDRDGLQTFMAGDILLLG